MFDVFMYYFLEWFIDLYFPTVFKMFSCVTYFWQFIQVIISIM